VGSRHHRVRPLIPTGTRRLLDYAEHRTTRSSSHAEQLYERDGTRFLQPRADWNTLPRASVRARARLRAEGPQRNGREPARDCPIADRTYAARMHVRLHGHHTPRNVHGRFCVIYDGALFVSLVGHLIFGCRAPVAHAHRDRKVRSDCATAFPLAAYIDRVPVSRDIS